MLDKTLVTRGLLFKYSFKIFGDKTKFEAWPVDTNQVQIGYVRNVSTMEEDGSVMKNDLGPNVQIVLYNPTS